MTEVRYLAGSEVNDLADPGEYVDVVRAAYNERGKGAPAEPRTKLASSAPPGMLTTYVAILPDMGYMGGYTYAAGFGGQDAWFITPLFDAESGELLALIDGAAMNPSKTGAAGAVAIDALAREDATSLGLIGAGSQARGQLLATATVRDLEEVRVYARTPETRSAFAEEMDAQLTANVRAVADTTSLVTRSDIIITATTASTPVFDGEDLQPGTHVTAMGQYHPDKRELDSRTVAQSRYFIDLRDRAFTDAGSFLSALDSDVITEDRVQAELGDVVAGEHPGRSSADEITVFDSGGTAIETVAAAAMLYERAIEKGRGTILELSPASESF